MEKKEMVTLSKEELTNINGGGIGAGAAAVLVGYICWAIDFCYDLGKD